MKKQFLPFLTRILGSVLFILALSSIAVALQSGAPSPYNYTGSPGDAHDCTSCHGGTATTVSGWITSNIPAQGYTAGNSYTITVTATGSGKKGFEVSPQNASGTQLGVLAAGTGSKIVGGTKYITQSSAGPTTGTSVWSFTWTAPSAGTGTVTFYGAICVGKPNTKLTTLVVSENLVVPLAVVVTATPSTIPSGGSSQLNASPSGGSGTYTYSWSSAPAGFTSTQQNPMVSPTITTQYFVTVNDGTGTVQGNVTVNVTVPPPLGVFVSANPTLITSGQASQLNASASGGSGSYTYSWTSLPAGFTSTQQNPLVWPTETTQYFVTVSDGSGTVQGDVTVTVTPVPLTAVASAVPSVICAGQSSQLNVVPAGGSGSYTYSWTSNPAGFTSSLQNPAVTPSVSTQYMVHVSDGVISVDAATNVSVNQPTTASAGSDTTFAYDVTQVPLHGVAASYSSVLWTTSGTGTFSAAGELTGYYFPSAADKTSGNITLTLTASAQSPCSAPATDTRIIHIDGPTGMADAESTRIGMVISPNPSFGLFKLRVSGLDRQNVTVTVSDITGRTIIQQDMDASHINAEKFDMSGYPKGLYLVKIRTNSASAVRKLVIE
jgi:hypothetical protein